VAGYYLYLEGIGAQHQLALGIFRRHRVAVALEDHLAITVGSHLPPQVLLAAALQVLVQLIEVSHLRQRNEEMATHITDVAFRPSLLVGLTHVGAATLKQVVTAKGDEGFLLLTLAPYSTFATAVFKLS